MTTNILDLQRLPTMPTLGFNESDNDVKTGCTLCTITCSGATAAD